MAPMRCGLEWPLRTYTERTDGAGSLLQQTRGSGRMWVGYDRGLRSVGASGYKLRNLKARVQGRHGMELGLSATNSIREAHSTMGSI